MLGRVINDWSIIVFIKLRYSLDSIQEFFNPNLEEIIERKVELRSLNPNSKSLSYITVCEIGKWKGLIIAYFNFFGNSEMEKSFENYTGLSLKDSTQGWEITQSYNTALGREIDLERQKRY